MEHSSAAAGIEPRLLDAVSRILEREGLRGLNISAIATEAGMSRVTLHRRGAQLDDYLVAVLGRASDDLHQSLWPVMTGPGTAAERLEAALSVLCDVFERHSGVVRAVYGEPPRPLSTSRGRTTSREFVEPFERLLEDGLADGSITCQDPREDALFLANSVAWTFLHMRLAHRWSRAKAVSRAVALAMTQLQPRATGVVEQERDRPERSS